MKVVNIRGKKDKSQIRYKR